MNILQHIYPGDVIASFVIRVLAEISLVTVAAFLLARSIARKNPALRHGICVCALLFVVSAPITTLGLEQFGWSTFSIRLESEKQALTTVAIPYGEKVMTAAVEPAKRFWTLERARDAASLIILIWALGTGVLLSRLVNGSRKVRALRRSAREIEDPKLSSALASVGFPTRAPIRFSKRLHSPVVVGPRQTTVILPEKLLVQLDQDQLRCVLAHELTHVRQRDPLIGLVQRLVEAGYWPHPMVHVLNRDLVRAREEVCDNAALNGTTAPQYADTLLTVALGMSPQHATLGIGLMTKKWRLEERVKGLLDPQRRLTTTMNTRHLAFVLVALAAGTAIIAGAHVVAAPNPPSLQQQSLDLYSHYNPKTKKVTVATKLTQLKPAKKAKTFTVTLKSSDGTSSVQTVNTGTWNVLPKGQMVRVRYAPANVHVFKDSKGSPGAQVEYVVEQAPLKPSKSGAFQVESADGKTSDILLNEAVRYQVSNDQPRVQVNGSTVTLDAVKPGDLSTFTVVSDDALKNSSQTVTVDAAKSAQSVTSSVTVDLTTQPGQTITRIPVLSDIPMVGRLFQDSAKSDKPEVVTIDGKSYVIQRHKDAQSGDTIVLKAKDGIVYLQTQESSKTPVTLFTTPRLNLDLKEAPHVRLYMTPQGQNQSHEFKVYTSRNTPLTLTHPRVTLVQPKVWSNSSDSHYKVYNLSEKPTSHQTTVYIDGDHIKVVGDNIKVVQVDSKTKKTTKPKGK